MKIKWECYLEKWDNRGFYRRIKKLPVWLAHIMFLVIENTGLKSKYEVTFFAID